MQYLNLNILKNVKNNDFDLIDAIHININKLTLNRNKSSMNS